MKHRLFTAIDLPDSLKQEIVSIQTTMEGLKLPIVWEPPEKLHITLNFLGRLADPDVTKAQKIVQNQIKSQSTFTLTPAFLETLYQRHDNSIAYLGLAGETQRLTSLYKSLAAAFDKMAITQPKRFLPHITLGRLKRTDPTSTKFYMDKIRDQEFNPLSLFTVDNITLFESFISRGGSYFQKIATYRLS